MKVFLDGPNRDIHNIEKPNTKKELDDINAKIGIDFNIVADGHNKVFNQAFGSIKSLLHRVRTSSKRVPYYLTEYATYKGYDCLTWVKVIDKGKDYAFKFGALFFDESEQYDKDGNPVINSGIAYAGFPPFILNDGFSKDDYKASDIFYISGHAIDRYCERCLKKLDYQMNDEELFELMMMIDNDGIIENHKYDGTFACGIKDGLFLGCFSKDGNYIFKTFVTKLFDTQFFQKRQMDKDRNNSRMTISDEDYLKKLTKKKPYVKGMNVEDFIKQLGTKINECLKRIDFSEYLG